MSVPAQRALRTAIESGKFDPVYYFTGDDEHRKSEALSLLMAHAVDSATRDFNVDLLRGAQLDAEHLGVALAALPMLAERRVVVLRDPGALKKAARATLEKYLRSPSPETMLVIIGSAGDKPDEKIAGLATTVDFPPLTGDKLRAWLMQHARSIGATIDDESAEMLTSLVGGDLIYAIGEIDKLASYAGERTITARDIEAVAGVKSGEGVGDLLDAVAARDGAQAAALVPAVLAQPKMSGVQLVMMLSVQFTAMAWGRASRDAGMPASRLESEFFGLLKAAGRPYLGRSWSEATKCWARNLQKWNAADLSRALVLLRDADFSLKDTRVSSDEAVAQSLVLAICLSRSRRPAAA
jgi:DNA polymerase-3 subunit delta